MRTRVHSSLALFLVTLNGLEALNVLAFFPIPWRSHQFVFKALVSGLGEAGHRVDFYTPLPITGPPKTVSQIQVYDTLKDALNSFDVEEFVNCGPCRNAQINYELLTLMMEKAITTGTWFRELLQSNATYDIVLTEFPLTAEPLAYIAHRFNALNVAVVPLLDSPWVNEVSGLPDNPSYMLSYQAKTDGNLDFLQRIRNTYLTVSTNLCSYWETTTRGQTFADKYIRYEGWKNRPKILDMVSDVALVLQNSHPSMAYPYPKAPHVKQVGGMHIMPSKPLPEHIRKFMDEAYDGVIYFSLGSNLDAEALMRNGIFEAFVNVFRKLKQRVVWKTNPGMPPVAEPNIQTQNWYPQQDILAHKNTVLFITHGGLQSMVETINCGVPVVGMPVMFDQNKNVQYLKSVGMGVELTLENVTELSLMWSINEVLSNPKYRDSAKKRREIFRDRPMEPVKEAVYWIEYVAKYGKVLQPAAAHMPFYQLYLIDVLGFILVSFVLFCNLCKAILVSTWSIMMPKKNVEVVKVKQH